MKVSFIPYVNCFHYDSPGSRILMSVMQDQGIDVKYEPIVYKIDGDSSWNGFHGLPKYEQFQKNLWYHTYDDLLEKQISNMEDIVLISVSDFQNLYVVDKVLKSGRKVIIGGTSLEIRGHEAIIDRLITYFGHDIKTLDRNLISVKGMVDKSTDLKSIINNWQTVEITENDFGSIYDCDYVSGENTNNTSFFVFKLQCPWMKCLFCNRTKLPNVDFIKNATADQIYNNFSKVVGQKDVMIVDDYFLFPSKILDVLKNVNNYIEMQTSVKELTKPEYIKNCNNHIHKIKFGLETLTDFSLKALKKPQDFAMVNKAADNIIEYGDPSLLKIQPFWIVDSPAQNTDMVKENYNRLMSFRQKFIDAGFQFSVLPSLMYLKESDPLVNSKKQYYGFETDKNYFSGISRVLNKDSGLVRYDEKGQKLISDMELIDKDIMNFIFKGYCDYGKGLQE